MFPVMVRIDNRKGLLQARDERRGGDPHRPARQRTGGALTRHSAPRSDVASAAQVLGLSHGASPDPDTRGLPRKESRLATARAATAAAAPGLAWRRRRVASLRLPAAARCRSRPATR